VDEADLLLEGEAGQQVLDARLERAGGVEVGRAVLGLGLRLRGDTAEQAGREPRGGGEGQGDEGQQSASSSGDSWDDRLQAASRHVLLRDPAFCRAGRPRANAIVDRAAARSDRLQQRLNQAVLSRTYWGRTRSQTPFQEVGVSAARDR
jgi:hypothetical protein